VAQDRVVIIGGGLSGLTAAHRIAERSAAMRRPVKLTVLEARNEPGGAIATHSVGGFTLERGPDSFITNKPWGVDLCRSLGLDDRLIGTDPQHRRSFVVRQGRLYPVPEGFVLMAPNRLGPILTTPILSFRGKLRMLMDLVPPVWHRIIKLFVRSKRTGEKARERMADALAEDFDTQNRLRRVLSEEGIEDTSLASFVKRRLGQEVLDRLVQPLVGGIYTADPADLSMLATFPRYLEAERDHHSVILSAVREARKVKWAERNASGARYGLFVTLADGMATLPRSLVASLPPGTVRLGTSVRRVGRPEPGKPWLIELLDGPPIESDAVILATESHASARMLDAYDPDLALKLRAIPYASSVIVNIAYRRDQIAHPLDGFGAVVPAIEGRSILAVSFLSVKFPGRAPAGTVLLRVFVGGATQPDLFDRDDEMIKLIVRDELSSLLGATGEPLLVDVARHSRAMPQYTLGHVERVAAIRRQVARHSRLILTGIAFDGVGIPDCIRAAESAADATLAALADPAAPAAA
jgi:oxygen-dependent protoporphyrinogen oxidase